MININFNFQPSICGSPLSMMIFGYGPNNITTSQISWHNNHNNSKKNITKRIISKILQPYKIHNSGLINFISELNSQGICLKIKKDKIKIVKDNYVEIYNIPELDSMNYYGAIMAYCGNRNIFSVTLYPKNLITFIGLYRAKKEAIKKIKMCI